MSDHGAQPDSALDDEVETLFVFGAPSWRPWVSQVFEAKGRASDILFPTSVDSGAVDALTRAIIEHPRRDVVFVSHHATLQRDEEIARAVEHSTGKRCFRQASAAAALAYDKRAMMEAAEGSLHCRRIPELDLDAARRHLRRPGAAALVGKHSGRTEGQGFSVLEAPEDLERFVDAHPGDLPDNLFQPFVAGIEFSVNATAIGRHVDVFEPVSKSLNTSEDWAHPCRRRRQCPDPSVSTQVRAKLVAATREYVLATGAQGLVELEFIVDGRADAWFLEINPRLSATTRMSCLVSEYDVFDSLERLIGGRPHPAGVVPFVRFSEELPITADERARAASGPFHFPAYSFSSRSTVCAPTELELRRRVSRLREFLQ